MRDRELHELPVEWPMPKAPKKRGGGMKAVIIMRGIPGSGKSTAANMLERGYASLDLRVGVFSTDNYFIDSATGKYEFDHTKLAENHKQNLKAFTRALTGDYVDIAIVDNTNVRHRDYAGYVEVADLMDYPVHVMTMARINPYVAAARNRHGVRLETIERMLDRWED